MIEKSPASEKLHGEKLMITGALGRVGTVLTSGLRDFYEFVLVDINGGNGIVEADVANMNSLEQMFNKVGSSDYIIHLAGVAEHDAPWDIVLKNNIIGISNVYEYARKHQVRRVVLASTTHIFGLYPEYPDKPSGRPIPIDAERRPDGFYAVSKAFGEDLSRYYYDKFGIETIVIRIGSLGQEDKPYPPYHLLQLKFTDAVQIFKLALETSIPYGIFYAISGESPIFDMRPTINKLGFMQADSRR